MFKNLWIGIILLQATYVSAQSAAQGDCRLDHHRGSSVSLLLGDKPLWSYHFPADGHVPYFHPLALADGAVLTAFAPPDHPWHFGLWFAWKFLNGVNYWDWAGKKEAIPDGTTQRVGEEIVGGGGKDPVAIEMTLQYKHKADVVLAEKRRIWRGPYGRMAATSWIGRRRVPLRGKTCCLSALRRQKQSGGADTPGSPIGHQYP